MVALVGMNVEAAVTMAESVGYEVVLDDTTFLTCDYRQNRLTLKAENGKVVKVVVG